MPTNRDVADFFELRQGFQGMADFAGAALKFMDRQGIALRGPVPRNGTNGDGNGNGHKDASAIRERVRRHYTTRRGRPRKMPADTPFAEGSITEPTPAAGRGAKKTHAQLKLEGRQISAALLNTLDLVEPRPVTGRGPIGALVRRGYAKKKGNGYVRTSKEFVVAGETHAKNGNNNGSAHDHDYTVLEAAKKLKMSDANVRLIIKKGQLKATKAARTAKNGRDMYVTMISGDELARYQANFG